MGCGSYKASDWAQLRQNRGLSTSAGTKQIFKNVGIKDTLDSRYISYRESKDSNDSPNSTPVIIGFDVTGSMDYLANHIATKSLNDTILEILESQTISNPHIMCAAFTRKDMPLQITQFEADIRVVEQLLDFSIGGYNSSAADNLLWYFAAKHTKIDSLEKRGKKGILIGIGDEKSLYKDNALKSSDLKVAFNEVGAGKHKFSDVMRMADKKYELFHIVIGEDFRFNPKSNRESYREWCDALPGRVARIHADNIGYLNTLIVSIIRLSQGEDKNHVCDSIRDKEAREVVEWGIADMDFGPLQYEKSKAYIHENKFNLKIKRSPKERELDREIIRKTTPKERSLEEIIRG